MSDTHAHFLGPALYEGLRWSMNFDAPQLQIIKDNSNRMTGEDIRRISRAYGFARNMSGDPMKMKEIATLVNAFAGRSWKSLSERAHDTSGVIDKIKEIEAVRFRLISGTTKLSWFVAPQDWTPFDRYAALGIGITSAGDQMNRMLKFYARLDENGYLDCARAIDTRLSNTCAESVGGTRVLDKFLMMRGGGNWGEDVRRLAIAFTHALPGAMREELESLAADIASDPTCQFEVSSR